MKAKDYKKELDNLIQFLESQKDVVNQQIKSLKRIRAGKTVTRKELGI